MNRSVSHNVFSGPSRLDLLLRDAIAIADAAGNWFEGPGRAFISALPPVQRLQANTEMLGVTARLMAAIAWLLYPAQAAQAMSRFIAPEDPPFGPDHPLQSTDGGEIAVASRALVQRLKEQA